MPVWQCVREVRVTAAARRRRRTSPGPAAAGAPVAQPGMPRRRGPAAPRWPRRGGTGCCWPAWSPRWPAWPSRWPRSPCTCCRARSAQPQQQQIIGWEIGQALAHLARRADLPGRGPVPGAGDALASGTVRAAERAPGRHRARRRPAGGDRSGGRAGAGPARLPGRAPGDLRRRDRQPSRSPWGRRAARPGPGQPSSAACGLPPGRRRPRASGSATPWPPASATRRGSCPRRTAAGPYLIMSTVGYADGRHHVRESADPYDKDEMLSVANGIVGLVGSPHRRAPAAAALPRRAGMLSARCWRAGRAAVPPSRGWRRVAGCAAGRGRLPRPSDGLAVATAAARPAPTPCATRSCGCSTRSARPPRGR